MGTSQSAPVRPKRTGSRPQQRDCGSQARKAWVRCPPGHTAVRPGGSGVVRDPVKLVRGTAAAGPPALPTLPPPPPPRVPGSCLGPGGSPVVVRAAPGGPAAASSSHMYFLASFRHMDISMEDSLEKETPQAGICKPRTRCGCATAVLTTFWSSQKYDS